MHIGTNRHLEKWDRDITLTAAYGLEPPEQQPPDPAVTREELMEAGVPVGRIEEIYWKLALWAERNPQQNQKQLLLALAKGYAKVR